MSAPSGGGVVPPHLPLREQAIAGGLIKPGKPLGANWGEPTVQLWRDEPCLRLDDGAREAARRDKGGGDAAQPLRDRCPGQAPWRESSERNLR